MRMTVATGAIPNAAVDDLARNPPLPARLGAFAHCIATTRWAFKTVITGYAGSPGVGLHG